MEGLKGKTALITGGMTELSDTESISYDKWKKLIDVNLNLVFLGMRFEIAAMKEAGSGSIINMCSIKRIAVDSKLSADSASKGSVRTFTKSSVLYRAQRASESASIPFKPASCVRRCRTRTSRGCWIRLCW